MKNLFYFLLLTFIVSSCSTEEKNKPIQSVKELKTLFPNPPSEYRTAPFWVWNCDVTEEIITRTLTDFKDNGFGGVFLHPRYGLITEYLSDDWWKLVSFAKQKAEELGLQLWIYDENSYPSGFAGGHVPAQMPESYNQGVALVPNFADTLQVDKFTDVIKHVFKEEGGKWNDITANYQNEIGKIGKFCVLELKKYNKSKWYAGYSYVDLLFPGVTEKFIDVTMTGYEKAIGAGFGKSVPGVFTDEPNVSPQNSKAIRFTPDLYEQFEKRWGYRLEPNLISLVSETGDWKKVRHDYQSVILQLFIDRWSKPWFAYAESKNLTWTGHYWEHGWPSPVDGPDNMAMYAWHQQPGIDMLFNNEQVRPDQFGNVRSVKELSSAGNQFSRQRKLSETYGGSGWELTFEEMKRFGDWEYVLGVNLMNQHLANMSLAGDRKHDYPQSFGPYTPYWKMYRYQADYFGRLSLALSSGIQENRILVVEPTTTAWMYFAPGSPNEKMKGIGKHFESFLSEMEAAQVEYDLASENIIKGNGRVIGKNFVVNKANYNMVVIPEGTENLDEPTIKLLSDFLKKGGKVVSSANTPSLSDGAESPELKQLSDNPGWIKLSKVTPSEIKKLCPDPGFSIQATTPETQEDKTSIKDLFHMRRQFKEGQLLFLTNYSKDETKNFEIRMKGKAVELFDLNSGMVKPFSFQRNKSEVTIPVTLAPVGSLLLFVYNKAEFESANSAEMQKGIVESGQSLVEREQPNILNLDYVELTMGKYKNTPMYFYNAANAIWNQHGFENNPWVSSSQFKTEIVDRDTFKTGSGFEVSYRFNTEGVNDFSGLTLVAERAKLYTISVNGTVVMPETGKYWLDPEFNCFDISGLVKTGKNSITVKASPFLIYCELEPVYLLGNFNLVPDTKGWKMVSATQPGIGPWKRQGMPFYGQTVLYSKSIEVKKEGDYLVNLPEWKGTVAEILLDGQHAGLIQAKPYEAEIKIPAGEHKISVRVYGSLKNTLGPHHSVPQRGIVSPGNFKTAPAAQPSGDSYDLLDYGLMQDFEVYKIGD